MPTHSPNSQLPASRTTILFKPFDSVHSTFASPLACLHPLPLTPKPSPPPLFPHNIQIQTLLPRLAVINHSFRLPVRCFLTLTSDISNGSWRCSPSHSILASSLLCSFLHNYPSTAATVTQLLKGKPIARRKYWFPTWKHASPCFACPLLLFTTRMMFCNKSPCIPDYHIQ